MIFIIRHKLSELEEEVYEFEICQSYIKYVGWYLSKRNDISEPFGYDWYEFYKDVKSKELDEMDKIYGTEEEIGIYDHFHPKAIARKEILQKYNPIVKKVLYGEHSYYITKNHPLKISDDIIIDCAIKEVMKLKIWKK